MIATLTSTEFLTTDTGISLPSSGLGYWILFGAAVLFLAVALPSLMDEEWLSGGLVTLAAVILAAVPLSIQFGNNQEVNQANRIQNVKTAYDVDDILLETWSESNPKAIVTKDGKSYEVILSENKKTFEPILSTLNNDSFDVEKLKRAQ